MRHGEAERLGGLEIDRQIPTGFTCQLYNVQGSRS
jgi:hypothetical protein